MNVVDKLGKYLNEDSVPIKLISGFHVGQFSGEKVQRIKKGEASQYIVPFFCELFDLKETNLTKAIANCVINLDNLAIQIDSLIDSKDFQSTSNLTIGKFDNLENKIISCFNPLSGATGLNQLVSSTLNCVNTSFYFNTSKRHLIYKFDGNVSCSGCTTTYLLPLIQYLGTQSEKSVNVDHLFYLTANYIQLLDDFIDVFEDVNSNIATPVTERFIKINRDLSTRFFSKSSFEELTFDVKRKLGCYLKAIDQETHTISRGRNDNEFLHKWKKFQSDFNKIPVPSENNNLMQKDYLRNINNNIPAMLCYTG